jgi:hypothetical protein
MEYVRTEWYVEPSARDDSISSVDCSIKIDRKEISSRRKRDQAAPMDVAVTNPPDLSAPLSNPIQITVTVTNPATPDPIVSAWFANADSTYYGKAAAPRRMEDGGIQVNFTFDPVPSGAFLLAAKAVCGPRSVESDYLVIVA